MIRILAAEVSQQRGIIDEGGAKNAATPYTFTNITYALCQLLPMPVTSYAHEHIDNNIWMLQYIKLLPVSLKRYLI